MDNRNAQLTAPKVSICLPAYKNPDLVKRCLDSVAEQALKDFEVIITDDSPDDSIEQLINVTQYPFTLYYYKNKTALGSPVNWNAAIKKAKGTYVKIMHHDDWLAKPDALQIFCNALDNNPEALFAFAANRDFVNGQLQPRRCDFKAELEKWKKNKSFLATYNFIGDPSTIIFRNHKNLFYDERMVWCVDTDFNLTLFEQNNNVIFIDDELIYIGTHPGQVTHTVQHNASIVLYENVLMLNKHGITKLNLKQYDFYWRMLRNFKVRNVAQLQQLCKEQQPLAALKRAVQVQSKIPYRVLQMGPVSKLSMFISYLFS